MGCESGWMKLCGAPAMSESWTLIQSSPVVLSTTDQPCRVAWLVDGALVESVNRMR